MEENPSVVLLGHARTRLKSAAKKGCKSCKNDQKEIDDVCEIFSQGAKEEFVPEA